MRDVGRRGDAVDVVGAARDQRVVRAALETFLHAQHGLRARGRLEQVAQLDGGRVGLGAVDEEPVVVGDGDARVARGEVVVLGGDVGLGVEEAGDRLAALRRADRVADLGLIYADGAAVAAGEGRVRRVARVVVAVVEAAPCDPAVRVLLAEATPDRDGLAPAAGRTLDVPMAESASRPTSAPAINPPRRMIESKCPSMYMPVSPRALSICVFVRDVQ